MGRQHQGMDRPGVCQVPEGSRKQRKMEETGCEIFCGAPSTLGIKGQVRLGEVRRLTGLKAPTNQLFVSIAVSQTFACDLMTYVLLQDGPLTGSKI